MQRVSCENVSSLRNLLKKEGKVPFPLIAAVLNGSQRGKIFADDAGNPKIIFVLTHSGFSQCFLLQDGALSESFIRFLSESAEIPSYFHIYDSRETFAVSLQEIGLVVKLRERQQLRFLAKDFIKPDALAPGYKPADCAQVAFNQFDSFKLDLESRFWSSASDFINNGCGKCILNSADLPVSICYSACIADGISEIDVLTLPEYRGKGFGRIATQISINALISKNLQANWDCFSGNIASLKIAKRIGFELIKKYLFLSVFNKIRQNYKSEERGYAA